MQTRTEYEGCPLCGEREIKSTLSVDCSKHPLYKPPISAEMIWLQCAACEHVYTSGYFTEEALEIVFSGTHEMQKVGFDIENQRRVSSRMIEKVLPYSNDGRWLDIGFGNGALLITADEYGFTCVGIDLRKDNVEAMNVLGIEAHAVNIADFVPTRLFNVLSMCDVLEHMPYPDQSLKIAHSLLDDNGILLLSMPNMDSILWALLNTADVNPYWAELEHYHNFGRKRLYSLLLESGFAPLQYGISERYSTCMEVIARKVAHPGKRC